MSFKRFLAAAAATACIAIAFNTPVSATENLLYDPADPFYSTPAEIPSQPGTLIRTEKAGQLIEASPATKILYSTTTIHGEPITASGMLIEPVIPWRGNGPVPTVVVAPGTRGLADVCAPSRAWNLLGAYDPQLGGINMNYDQAFVRLATLAGMRVVVTDYIGLGTPGLHTYAMHTEEAHAVLDAARAGLAAAHVSADSPVAFWGYSQGGGATGATAELAAEYAPDLNVKGTFAGAPDADLPVLLRNIDSTIIMPAIGYAVNSYSERFPEFRTAIDENLNQRGQEFLESVRTTCIPDAMIDWKMQDTRAFTKTGEPLYQIIDRDPRLSSILYDEKLGHRTPHAPIMLGVSMADDLVPESQVTELHRTYCADGGKSTLLKPNLPTAIPLPMGDDHMVGMAALTVPSLQYLTDRFNDVPVTNVCQ